MEKQIEYVLTNLTSESVSIAFKEYVLVNDEKLYGKTRRCAYSNNEEEKVKLRNELPEKYYNAIISVWE